jgi:hypothetical protein
MTTESGTKESCSFRRPPVAEGILVILLGLTAKAALDQMFALVPCLDGFSSIWSLLQADRAWHLCLVGQGIIFFFTAFRFYLGSLRYHRMRGGEATSLGLAWDVVGTLIIFVGFYLCALSIRSRHNFYLFMGGLHLLDLLWFLVALVQSSKISGVAEKYMKRFIRLDVVTLGLLLGIVAIFWAYGFPFEAPYVFQWLCFSVLLAIGITDFIWNNRFYSGKENEAA